MITSNAQSQVTCTVCLSEAASVPPGTPHRRCPGAPAPEGQPVTPRPKHKLLPSAQRGTWE